MLFAKFNLKAKRIWRSETQYGLNMIRYGSTWSKRIWHNETHDRGWADLVAIYNDWYLEEDRGWADQIHIWLLTIWIFFRNSSTHTHLKRMKTQRKFTGSKISANFWQITSRDTTKNLKFGQRGNFEKLSFVIFRPFSKHYVIGKSCFPLQISNQPPFEIVNFLLSQ